MYIIENIAFNVSQKKKSLNALQQHENESFLDELSF